MNDTHRELYVILNQVATKLNEEAYRLHRDNSGDSPLGTATAAFVLHSVAVALSGITFDKLNKAIPGVKEVSNE